MRRLASSVVASALIAVALMASSVVLPTAVAAAQTPVIPTPANLRVTDLQIDSVTVAWDPVTDAAGYSVGSVGLDVGGPLPRTKTTATTVTIPKLLWEARYRITVLAFTAGLLYSDAAEVTVTTPTPEAYRRPLAPTNLRLERNATGEIERFVWDAATGGRGPLRYVFYVDSPGFLTAGPLLQTSELSISAYDIPVCNGCQLGADQTIIVWVRAGDLRYLSPESERLVLTCCPF